MVDNIGLPVSSINLTYGNSGTIGSSDADILISLTPGHAPTADYVRTLRLRLPREFPGTVFAFPAGGHRQPDSELRHAGAHRHPDRRRRARRTATSPTQLLASLRHVPGLVDLRIQQVFNQPELRVHDRPQPRPAARHQPARRRQQPAADALRQRPDRADLLAELRNRAAVPAGRSGAAVPHDLAAGPAEPAGDRRRPAADSRRPGDASPAAWARRWSYHYDAQNHHRHLTAPRRIATSAPSTTTSARRSPKFDGKLPKGTHIVLRGQVQTMTPPTRGWRSA